MAPLQVTVMTGPAQTYVRNDAFEDMRYCFCGTETPCVGGSIAPRTTFMRRKRPF